MVVCVCGGWRLSCAEQGSSAAGAATIIPRGAGPVFPPVVPPRDLDNNDSRTPPDETTAAAAGRKSKAPPRRLWSSDRHMMTGANAVSRSGGGGGGSGRDFVKDSGGKFGGKDAPEGRRLPERARSDNTGRADRGGGGGSATRTSGDRSLARRLPSYQDLVGYSRSDSGIVAPSTSKHHHNPSTDSAAVEMMNPMFNSGGGLEDAAAGSEGGGGWADRMSDSTGSGAGSSRRQRRNFDRYMLSRSPRKSAGGAGFSSSSTGGSGSAGSAGAGAGGARAALASGVFSSVSGSGSVSMKSSIDAHLTSSGGRFYSNTEPTTIPEGMVAPPLRPRPADNTTGGGGSNRSNGGSSEDEGLPGDTDAGGVGPRPRGRTAELSSSGSGGSSSSAKTANSAVAAAAAAAALEAEALEESVAANATRAPVLAPGAPTIDGHLRRFGGNRKFERSSSSFASTSFESGTTGGNRKRRSDQARVMANWRRSTGSQGGGFSHSRPQTISRASSSGGDGGGGAVLGPPSFVGAGTGVVDGGGGKVRGMPLFRRNSSDASGSFLSQGSGSVGSWASPTTRGPGPPPPPNLRYLRAVRSRSQSSSQMEFEVPGFGGFPAAAEGPDGRSVVVGDSSNLGGNWVPTQSARGGWPLDLPARSAMPRWWNKYASRSGDSQSDLAAGAPPDLVLAAAERAKAAEQEAAAARVEAVFGDENHLNERRFSNADGGSNIVDFRAFVRAGGSGTSSFDSRASESGRRSSASTVDEEGSDASASSGGGGNRGREKRNRVGGHGDLGLPGSSASGFSARSTGGGRKWGSGGAGRKPTVRSRSSSSGGSAAATPLSSAELRKHLDFDFEDEGELEEDPVSFVRVSERVSKINAKVVGRGADGRSSSPMPWPASQAPP